ncbi:MAG: bifunctional tRNA (5-methylaminomethyl-2-thiouridine)(34)-methyltransferase MnmD/FAD-dependent 5-carboxymethylaminomethyl-2-thiouridine(34) oxidoreductase MnmC [Gammaproteobacteria bacterium]|nr:bifunctional tRNA (5-methylaminomethyl-2-thiouridine)(34)-methyltransferase MnmD/FAD-dependent 5-carboxymethylaminomethyl-2-thiouridine(34) oxidoreductase MnmC [Gammaproteobacteria bacterium]MBU1645272.1 bifunctional tRNA (5-methylaminomethyl-2-thiouridine)(34)-methyltransferase MnmD/FAD-dependent 5-carboxymethylaminomethyl-2-thiouridine(34) oxidoreductase MnmC [Gammaproteobacteria bacterium]MBU1971609.1 bifunctional tRNA (5-methylaminomethyl-2-thiouridine)(34)-methyltransferase MnmD/FAD-depen
MTYHPLVAAELAFDGNGTPCAPAYGDYYHPAGGGLAQARHVFLGGNDLLGENARWRGRDVFVILETGFGPGLNFLATWLAWRGDPQRCRRLHFVSVEKHPLRADDMARLHAAFPELAPLAAQLRAQWPLPLPGMHRLHFDNDQVSLTLALGDAQELLQQLVAHADAFFLDGFAPAKNPDLWSNAIVTQLRRLAAPGATLATWSLAAGVIRRLASADFLLEKRPGFGRRREMLVGRLPATVPPQPIFSDRRIAVIGAGIAGTSIAERLAARGFEVTLIDAAPGPANGASGNPVGIIRPLPSLDDNRLSRWLRAGYLHATRHLSALEAEGLPLRWSRCGVLHLARDAQHEGTQRRAIAEQQPPPEFARFVERAEATQLAGWPVEAGGWWFGGGAWIIPPSLCAANLARHADRVTTRYCTSVGSLTRSDGLWRMWAADGSLIAEAPQVVLAAGAYIGRLVPERMLPVWPGRGTVSLLPQSATPSLDIVACRLGYVTPAVDGIRCAGATMARDDDSEPRAADHIENLHRLDMILPGFGKALDQDELAGRTSFRPMSPDRLPLAGALLPALDAVADGLHVLSGFGARGLVWTTLAAELLACRITGEPLPLEADLAAAAEPARFLAKPPRRRRDDKV